MPKFNRVHKALYADDTALFCAGRSPTTVAKTLQTAVTALANWFRKWRLEINPEKSQAVMFTRRTARSYSIDSIPSLKIFNKPVTWTRQAKYLGVTLDDRLSFAPHIKQVRARAAFVMGRLHCLLNSRSRMPLSSKVRLYTTCIRPIMTYASVVFAHVKPHRIHRLQTLQNRFMRRATGAPWFIRNVDLHIDLELPTIKQFMKRCSQSYFDSAMTHPNQLVVGAASYRPSKISSIRRPRHVLDEEDDNITLAQQRAYTAREALTNKYPRFRPRRRGAKPRRAKVTTKNVGTPTLPPATPQAEVRSPQGEPLGDVA